MKASKLIDQLEEFIAKYGDLNVRVYDGESLLDVHAIAAPDDGDGRGRFIICDKNTIEAFG